MAMVFTIKYIKCTGFTLLIGLSLSWTNYSLSQDLTVNLNQISANITICGNSGSYEVIIQKTIDGPINNVSLSPQLFRGMTYVLGSAGGDAIGDNGDSNNPIINLPDMTGIIGQTYTIPFEVELGCEIIPLGNAEVVELDVIATYLGGSVSPPTGPEEIQVLQPALSILNINDEVTDAARGTTFTRDITFVNGGFGSLSDWVYKSAYGTAIDITSLELYDPVSMTYLPLASSIIAGGKDTITATITATEIQIAANGGQGNGNALFELNENIIIRETVEVLDCDDLETVAEIVGEWGCRGSICDQANEVAFVRFGFVTPELTSTVSTWAPPYCHGSPENRTVTITNNGQDIATNVEIDIRNAYGTNGNANQLVLGGFDVSNLTYSIDGAPPVAVSATAIQPIDTTGGNYYSRWTIPCVEENPEYDISFFTVQLPNLPVGSSLELSFGLFRCCLDVCNAHNWYGWDYDVRYQDGCESTDLDIDHTDRWTPATAYYRLDGTSSSPPDVFHLEAFEYQLDFGSNSRRYFSTQNSGFLELRVILPAEFTFNGTIADLGIVGPGNGIWAAENFTQVADTLFMQYGFTQPFTVTGGFLKIPLVADCFAVNPSGSGGPKNIKTSAWVNFDDALTCDPQCLQPLFCEQTIITQLHCPGCDEPGMVNLGFQTERVSLGQPDNDQDGFADASGGSLNEAIIRKDRAIEGDTLRNFLTGVVNANGGVGFMGPFDYGYARIAVQRPNISFVANSSTVRVYDASNGMYFDCAGLPPVDSIKNSTQSSYTFDYSVPTLSLLGCSYVDNVPGEGGVFQFDHGDSVWVNADIQLCTRFWSGGPALERNISSEYYLSYVDYAQITGPDDKFSCDNYSSKFIEIPHATAMSGNQSYDFDGCEEIYVAKDFYTYYAGFGGNIYAQAFPGEYRNLTNYDTVKMAFPKEYNIGEAQIWFRTPNGRAGFYDQHVIQTLPDGIISGTTHDTIIYDIKKYYGTAVNAGRPPAYNNNGGIGTPSGLLEYGTESHWFRFYLSVLPTCNTPESEIRSYWWMEYEKNDTRWCGAEDLIRQSFSSTFADNAVNQYYDGNLRQNYTFDRPQITADAPVTITRPKQTNFSWEVDIFNAPGATADNGWIYVENNSLGIVIDGVYDLDYNVYLSDTGGNGIYQIGNLGSNTLRHVRIEANTTNCAPDSVIYHVGWDCTDYPATFESYSCQTLSQTLYVQPEEAELQMQIITAPTNADLCAEATYEIQLLSAKKAHLFDVNFRFSLPEGMSIVPSTFEMEYPAGSGYFVTTPQPINLFANWYQLNVSDQHPILSSAQGFEGVEAPAGSNLNLINLRFDVTTDCDYTSGRRIRFFSWAFNACGGFNNYQFSPVQPYEINGASPPPYIATLLADDMTLGACIGEQGALDIYWRSGAELTGLADSIEMTLPYGIGYVPNSFTPITGNASTMIPFEGVIDNNPDSVEYTLKFHIPPNLDPFTIIEFSVDVEVLRSKLDCQGYSIDLFSSKTSNAVCVDDGMNCNIKSQTAFVDELQIFIEKPELSIISIEGSAIYAPPNENIDLDITIQNTGSDLPNGTTTTVDIYEDTDNNFMQSIGDVFLTSVSTTNEILSNGTTSFSSSFSLPAGQSCGLVAVIDTVMNCACAPTEVYFSIDQLSNAGEDHTVCSTIGQSIGLDPVAGYTYEWIEIFPAPITALSATNISNPTFTYINTNNVSTTFEYILRTLRPRGDCLSEDTMAVSIYPYSEGMTETFACPGVASQLHGPLGFSNYQWSPSTELVNPNDPETIVNAVNSNILYTLTYDDANGCPSIFTENMQLDLTCADLELTKTVNPTMVNIGEQVTYTVSITNIGPGTATGIQVEDILPDGVSAIPGGIIASHGVFNSLQDLWNFQNDSLVVNETATLNITVTVNDGLLITNIAQITAHNETDADSNPDNDDPSEDDQDFACVSTSVVTCFGDTVRLAVPDIFSTYQWQRDAFDIVGATNTTLAITEAGDNIYILTGEDAKGNPLSYCPVNVNINIATIDGFVWFDDNGDGLQTGESGFTSVTLPVELYTANGALIAQTNVDASGYYLFSNNTDTNQSWYNGETGVRVEQDYFVVLGNGSFMTQTIQDGTDIYTLTTASVGTDDAIDSDGIFATSSSANAFDDLPAVAINIANDNICTSVQDFGITRAALDYGDLPDGNASGNGSSYPTDVNNNGPRHLLIPGFYIGNNVNNELNGQGTAAADGDVDDGFEFPASLNFSRGNTVYRPLEVQNTTGMTAYLRGWVDWNGDGDFDDAGELIVDISDDANGNFGISRIAFEVPYSAVYDHLIGMRFRLSNEPNLSPTGFTNSGEVEDYLILIGCEEVCLPISTSIIRN